MSAIFIFSLFYLLAFTDTILSGFFLVIFFFALPWQNADVEILIEMYNL